MLKTLGDIIALERKRKGWSQVDLADILQCGEYTLARWETGQAIPCPRLLIEIEDAFGWQRGRTLAIIAEERVQGGAGAVRTGNGHTVRGGVTGDDLEIQGF